MMVKRGFTIVVFLLFSLSLAMNSFAACCTDSAISSYICTTNQPNCRAGSYLADVSCDQVDACKDICLKCQQAGSVPAHQVGKMAVGCTGAYDGYLATPEPTISVADCESQTATTTPPLYFPDISGKIFSGTSTNEPNAYVECMGNHTYSDSNGNYKLVNCLKYVPQEIKAKSATGNKENSTTIISSSPAYATLNSGSALVNYNIRISVPTKGSLKVLVTNAAGTANLDGAAVQVQGGSYSSTLTTTSSLNPVIFTNVPLNTPLTITVTKTNYITSQTTNYQLTTTLDQLNIPLILLEKTQLNGKVYNDASGTPPTQTLKGVSIQTFLGTTKIGDATSALADGSYSVDVPKNQPFKITLTFANFVQSTPENHAAISSATTENLLMSPGAPTYQFVPVTFNITDKSNNPLKEISVKVEGEGNTYQKYTDNVKGQASFNIPKGTYLITISDPHFNYVEEQMSDLVIDAQKTYLVSLNTVQTATMTGTVADTQGHVIPNAVIIFSQNGGTASTTTDSSGVFSLKIKIPNDITPVYAKASGFITGFVNLDPTKTFNVGQIRLESISCSIAELAKPSGKPTLDAKQEKNTIRLSWGSICSPDSFIIMQQKPTGFEAITVVPGTDATYVLKIQPDTTYTFKLKASYFFAGADTPQDIESNIVTIKTGPEQCFNPPRQFCDGSKQMECSEDYTATELSECDDMSRCSEISTIETRCIPSNKCDWCDRPFGVFSLPATQIGEVFFGARYKFGTAWFSCTSELGSEDAVACYKDYSITNADKYYECTGMEKCYDYASQEACEANPAHKCNPNLNCKWQSSKNYPELGIGVCTPIGEKDCSAFSESIPRNGRAFISNQIFAPTDDSEIAKELCMLYGDTDNPCYYRKSAQQCLNGKETSCYDYDNSQDCIGTSQMPVSVDVLWEPITSGINVIWKKTSGTHKIIQNSTDIMKIGLCRWLDYAGKCVKDADANEELNLQGANIETSQNDCNDLANRFCTLDKTTPETTPEYGPYMKDIATIPYTVVDDNSVKSQIKTFFKSISRDNSESSPIVLSYPTTPASVSTFSASAPGNNIYENWTIFYYSMDSSHNLEHVRRMDFILDKIKPTLTVDPVINVVDQVAGMIDLDISISLDKNSDHAGYCIAKDRDGNSVAGLYGNPSAVGTPETPAMTTLSNDQVASSWSELYTGINAKTGTILYYKIDCFDRAGNERTQVIPILIDLDMTISHPTKQTVAGGVNVPVSVQTQRNGNCSYIDFNQKTQAFSSWTPFDKPVKVSNNVYNHSSKVTFTTEHARYAVACNLEKTTPRPYYGTDDVDDIKLTIDNKPPITAPYVIREGEEKPIAFNPVQWVGPTTVIKLKCQDVIQDPSYPPESGCKTVNYCFGISSCTPESINSDEIELPSQSGFVNYFSEDNLGNIEQPIKSQQLKYDETGPIVTILVPITDYLQTSYSTTRLKANINNPGNLGEMSPLDVVNYRILDQQGNIVNNIDMNLSLTTSDKLKASLDFTRDGLVLKKDSWNYLVVRAVDEAGNYDQKSVAILQDSTGPNLDNMYTNNRPIDYGTNFDLEISNVLDKFIGTSSATELKRRVSDVWAKDMFGAEYRLKNDSIKNFWTATIKTKSWLVSSPEFRTYLTIYANDSLGNIAQKELRIQIIDRWPPWASFRLENLYGEDIHKLIKGMNYIVLNASERLGKTPDMYFEVVKGEIIKNYNVTFDAHDFEAITWIGHLNITDDINDDRVEVRGVLTDANGLQSADFTPSFVRADAIDFEMPVPNKNAVNGVYYVAEKDNVPYQGFDADHDYQITADNKVINADNTASKVSGFNPGQNIVKARVEDSDHVYQFKTYKVFVDAAKPKLILAPTSNAVYTDSSKIKVTFEDPYGDSGFSSGLDNKTTSITLTNSTGQTLTFKLANPLVKEISPSLRDGQYSGSASISDRAGNVQILSMNFRINANAPTVTLQSSDISNVNGIYLTNKEKPAITLGVSNLVAPNQITSAVLAVPPSTTISALAAPATSGTALSSLDLTSDPSLLTVSDSNGNQWIYTLQLDQMPPSPSISTNPDPTTNSNPLKVTVVSLESYPLASISLSVDDVNYGQMVKSSDSSYSFSQNIALGNGAHTIKVTAKDAAGNEASVTKTVTIDNTLPVIGSTIDIKASKLLDGNIVVNKQSTEINGTSDKNLMEAYVIGQDGKKYPGQVNGKKFTVSDVKLVGRQLLETRNELTVFITDTSGNTVQKTIFIIKDMKPPELIQLLFTRI